MDYVNGRFYLRKEELDNRTLDELINVYGMEYDRNSRKYYLPCDIPFYVIEDLSSKVVMTDRCEEEVKNRKECIDKLLEIQLKEDEEIEGVSPKLDGYQRVGVKYLSEVRRGILGDYMGMGKTAEAICACDYVRAKKVLVIVKKSLITNWIREINKFCIGDKSYAVMSTRGELPDVRFTIVSYETLMYRWEYGEDLGRYDVVIADEATKILNRKAKRTKAVKAVAKNAKYVWLLTGTIIRNRPDELWSMLNCLYPSIYTSYWRFRRRHCIESPVFGADGKIITYKIIGIRDPENLRKELAPLILRRGKEKLNLPDISYHTLYAGMNEIQAKLYAQMEATMTSVLDEGKILNVTTELAKITRLRQLCLDPRLVGGNEVGGKTEAIAEFVDSMAEDYKIIIFSTFTEYLKLLNKDKTIVKYNPVMLIGEMNLKERDIAMNTFQEDENCRVFLGNIDAAGEGLNITAGDIVLFANCPWTPDMMEQAISRAWRRGREKPVSVFKIITADTVEEYVDQLLSEKKGYYNELELIKEYIRSKYNKNL